MSYFLRETLLLLHCRRKSTPISWHEKAPQVQGFFTIYGNRLFRCYLSVVITAGDVAFC
jgi:hypothetical protein